MRILAIDPGNVESGWCVIDAGGRRPLAFGKTRNSRVLDAPGEVLSGCFDRAVIEMVASYGMPVGAEVFDTCVWIGRFQECLIRDGVTVELVKRQPVKLHLCHSSKAKDANVTQALVDRFAPGQTNHGKGTKKDPGWFYGFRADIWQAYALAVYAADTLAGSLAGELFGPGVTGRPGASEGLQAVSGGAR